MRQRTFKLLRTAVVLLCAGLLYAVWVRRTGLGIPCPFYTLTKLRCPGCGMTRMALCLLRGDLRGAFAQNRAALLMLPAGLYAAAAWTVGYVKRGDRLLHGVPKATVIGMIGVFLAFGVVRNFLNW